MKISAWIAVVALLLSACQQTVTQRTVDRAHPASLQGSILQLHAPLHIPPGFARAFVQNGQVGRAPYFGGDYDHYRPHCGFEIERVDHDGFTIRPGEFRITRVQDVRQPVVSLAPLVVAGRSKLAQIDGGSGYFYAGYHFYLASGAQAEVTRMSCYGAYSPAEDLQPPSLVEIRQALGGVAQLH